MLMVLMALHGRLMLMVLMALQKHQLMALQKHLLMALQKHLLMALQKHQPTNGRLMLMVLMALQKRSPQSYIGPSGGFVILDFQLSRIWRHQRQLFRLHWTAMLDSHAVCNNRILKCTISCWKPFGMGNHWVKCPHQVPVIPSFDVFFFFQYKQVVKQIVDMPVIWDEMMGWYAVNWITEISFFLSRVVLYVDRPWWFIIKNIPFVLWYVVSAYFMRIITGTMRVEFYGRL